MVRELGALGEQGIPVEQSSKLSNQWRLAIPSDARLQLLDDRVARVQLENAPLSGTTAPPFSNSCSMRGL